MSPAKLLSIKGAFPDSNNLFLWHLSINIHNKSFFQKFQVILIMHLQERHDYVHYIAP